MHGLVAVKDGGHDYHDGHGPMPHGHVSVRPAAHLSTEVCLEVKTWASAKGGNDPHHLTAKVQAALAGEQKK